LVNAAPAAPVQDGGVLRITPSLYISTLSGERATGAAGAPPTINFRAGVSGTYREFFGPEVLRKQRNMAVTSDARLDILPGRPWSFAVFGSYVRMIQPTVLGNPDLSFNNNSLGVGGEIIAQPNSGTLDWHLGYQLRTTLFESSEGTPFNNLTHEIGTRGRWKFRPRTAFLYDGTVRLAAYSEADRAVTRLHNSTPVRARLGLAGLVTPRLSLLAMAGWGSSFFRPGSDPSVHQFDCVIGHAELKFFPTANPGAGDGDASLTLSSIAVGYTRDFQGSFLGDYYGSDRGYAKVAYFFAGRALVSLEGGVAAIEYPDIFYNQPSGGAASTAPAVNAFTDVRADATLFAEYRVIETVGINATFNYTQNFSDTQVPQPAAAGQPQLLYDMSWKRFQAFLGVRWLM
jgi:hypothetical protein